MSIVGTERVNYLRKEIKGITMMRETKRKDLWPIIFRIEKLM